MHAALQSNATLASSIEGIRDTFSKHVAPDISNSSSTFVRRKSLDNKIRALEERITNAAALTAPSSSVSENREDHNKTAKTRRKTSQTKQAKKQVTKKRKSKPSKKHVSNSAFAVGQSSEEEIEAHDIESLSMDVIDSDEVSIGVRINF